jgi:catechol 2,3-dioxygenase-like lactoylglutathione lyase family enzyme
MNTSAPLANLITLGARDLPALRDFYRTLGWPQITDDGEFVAFELRGIVLALFPLAKLARDGNTEPEPGTGGIRFTIGVMVDSADEVDRLTEQMRSAGARVTKEPVDAEFFTGRSAYLCDPEGNYFEIAWADMPNNLAPCRSSSCGPSRTATLTRSTSSSATLSPCRWPPSLVRTPTTAPRSTRTWPVCAAPLT